MLSNVILSASEGSHTARRELTRFSPFFIPNRVVDMTALSIWGRIHSDAQFAGSSSVPAHVEMMGFLGIGNNPMVGATVAIAVDIAGALSK